MNGIQNTIAATAILCTCAITNAAHATLIDGAWSGTTLDTTSGLTWVNINNTKSLSINMALNSSWMTDRGFQYATYSQVEGLFTNAGVTPGGGLQESYAAGAADLNANFGKSYTSFFGPSGWRNHGRGLYGYDTGTHTAGWAEFAACYVCGFSGQPTPDKGSASIGIENDWSMSLDYRVYSFGEYKGGHWLVYDSNAGNATVPLPSSLLLMATGILGLGLWKRRHA
ncbi:PEP-CTERM sorting domain-containing protein [Pseudomonadota bacterium]